MKNVCRVFLPTLACLTLIAPVWALPATTTHGATVLGPSNNQNAPQEQSVSGKIVSVEKNSFTLTVGQSQTSSERHHLQQDPASPKTMTFQLRSEERRVGKECRSRWEPYDEKKK